MRRLATAVPTVVATVAAVLTLSTGTALAHSSEHSAGQRSHVEHASHSSHGHDGKKGKKTKPIVTLTGVISDTPTATIGAASDPATSTITLAVKGGERAMHAVTLVLTLDSMTVVRRGDRAATAADLVKGDHVSARVRRMPDGSWLALRVNASGRPDSRHHEDTANDD